MSLDPTQQVRLVLTDVDGTLVNSRKELTPQTIAAVAELRRAGIDLAVTSGRPPRGLRMLVDPLRLDTVLAGFNGGLIVHPDLTPITQRLLATGVAEKALEIIHAHGISAWVFKGEDWFVRDYHGPHVERESHAVHYDPIIVPAFTEDHLNGAIKIVGVSDEEDLLIRAEQAVVAALGKECSASRSQTYYLDVTHPDANKGTAVHDLSRILGIPAEQIIAIGDGHNDLPMFQATGGSIAMGNAVPEVKDQASAITDSNDHDGFAKAVRMILSR